MSVLKAACLMLLGVTFTTVSALGETTWPRLKHSFVTEVRDSVQVTHAGDGSGRMFIVSSDGRVMIHKDGELQGDPFLDIYGRVSRERDSGLLGIAFPDGFGEKGHFYAAYVDRDEEFIVVSRFKVRPENADQADDFSEEIVLRSAYRRDSRSVAKIGFGPDSFLYIGLGDNGSRFDRNGEPQDLGSLLGKMLRIDTESDTVPYGIPADNPFVGVDGARGEIWATGLQMPRHFSFDRLNGDLFIADVGSVEYQEVNFQPATSPGGENYGWPYLEGSWEVDLPPGYDVSQLTPPAIQYAHALGNSITGGFVYRGPPSALTGIYLYADRESGRVFGMKTVDGIRQSEKLEQVLQPWIHIGEDESGMIYAIREGTGEIFEITEDTQAPTPELSPFPGTYENDQLVRAYSTVADVTFRYTTSGEDPSEDDPELPISGLALNTDTILKVRAFHPALDASDVSTANYKFATGAPIISSNVSIVSPVSGATVLLRSPTEGAILRYTTDGSAPGTSSPLYTGSFRLEIGPATVRAIAYRDGYAPSRETMRFWDAPTLSAPSVYSQVDIDNRDADFLTMQGFGQIHYTLDGSAPTQLSPVYSNPLPLVEPTSVKARSFQHGYHPSVITSTDLLIRKTESGSQVNSSGTLIAGYVDSELWYESFYRAPEDVCLLADGRMIVADTGNHVIRAALNAGAVSTYAGTGSAGYVDGASDVARFSSPRGVCCDSLGNVFVADDGNHVIRKISPEGMVSTFAGSGQKGTENGTPATASFSDIQGIVPYLSGGLLVGDLGRIRRIDAQGNVTTLAVFPLQNRVDLTVNPEGRIFATDGSPRVYEVGAQGQVSVYAGGIISGLSDGQRQVARFQSATAISSDRLAIIYVCDNNGIRKIYPDGFVRTLVSPPTSISISTLSSPKGLVINEKGEVFIADTGHNRIRKSATNDWDRDGITDADEDPTSPFILGEDDRLADADGDGQSNSMEYRAGTDPRDPSSQFGIHSLVPQADGKMKIQWQSIRQRGYDLVFSTDLVTWTVIGKNYSGNGNLYSVIHDGEGSGRVFYKVGVR